MIPGTLDASIFEAQAAMPMERAFSLTAESRCAENSTIIWPGCRDSIRSATSSPVRPGIRLSSRTTDGIGGGLRSRNRSSAWGPSSASSMTLNPSLSRKTRASIRISGSSSTTKTLGAIEVCMEAVMVAVILVRHQGLARQFDDESRGLTRGPLGPDPALVGVHDPARDVEAATGPGDRHGTAAHEPGEAAPALVRVDPGAVVLDNGPGHVVGLLQGDLDGDLRRRVLARVVEQIGEDLLDAVGIALH